MSIPSGHIWVNDGSLTAKPEAESVITASQANLLKLRSENSSLLLSEEKQPKQNPTCRSGGQPGSDRSLARDRRTPSCLSHCVVCLEICRVASEAGG